MEFWGVEIKGEKPQKVQPDIGQVVHLSQATLGDLKKGGDPIVLSVRVGTQKLVIGILTADIPQLSFDLVFEKEFELSHNAKNGSVHLCGYKSYMPDDDELTDYSDGEEDLDLENAENGKPAALAAAPSKPKPQSAEKPKEDKKPKVEAGDDEDDSDDDEDDEGDSDEDDESDDEDMADAGSDDDDDEEEEDDDEDDKKASKPVDAGKKRPASATKTPEPKKAKVQTPQKTDGKKGSAHTATPHPAKKAGKTPADGDKPKPQTPKSAVTCQTCKKTFNSDNALQSHNKAKHTAGK